MVLITAMEKVEGIWQIPKALKLSTHLNEVATRLSFQNVNNTSGLKHPKVQELNPSSYLTCCQKASFLEITPSTFTKL
jgi:hypothetical protein